MAHSNYITISLKLQELSVLNIRDNVGADVNFKQLSLREGIAYTTCRHIWHRAAKRGVEYHKRPSVKKRGT